VYWNSVKWKEPGKVKGWIKVPFAFLKFDPRRCSLLLNRKRRASALPDTSEERPAGGAPRTPRGLKENTRTGHSVCICESLEESGIRSNVSAGPVEPGPRNSGATRRHGTPRRVHPTRAGIIPVSSFDLPFLRLAAPRATYSVTFHVSAVTPVTAAGNTIRLVTAVVVERSREPAGTIHAFVQAGTRCHAGRGRSGL